MKIWITNCRLGTWTHVKKPKLIDGEWRSQDDPWLHIDDLEMVLGVKLLRPEQGKKVKIKLRVKVLGSETIYVAMDGDGEWWAYSLKPQISGGGWLGDGNIEAVHTFEKRIGRSLIFKKGRPWKKSLQKIYL